VNGVMVAQLSRLGMALGPLVGAGEVSKPADDKPAALQEDSVPDEDLPATARSPGGVSALVTDLAPDDSVSSGEAAPPKSKEKPAAAKPVVADPGAPKRYKPGTRPLTRPARDEDEEQGGR